MRIALVAHHGSPLSPATGQGPVPQAAGLAAHAQALAKLGHRVTVYARRDSRGLPGSAILAPRVTVEHVAAGPPAPLAGDELVAQVGAFGDHLAQSWRRNPPDLAHAYFWTSGLAALAAVRGLGVPLVQTFGTLAVAEQRRGAPGPAQDGRIRMEACIARSAHAVLAGTTAEESELAKMSVPRASVTVVPCGIDTDEFTPEGPASKRTRRPRLLAVAPLDDGQGLSALMRLLARIPGAELVLAGGRARLSKERAAPDLTHLARRFGVTDRLSVTGKVTAGGLAALLRSADLLVSTGPYDPVGAVAIASMACGTPVAACSASGLSDAIVDGTTGVLAPAGRPDLLARPVRQLLASPLRLEAFGIAAADRARCRYSWERISRETLGVYERCLRPAAAGTAAARLARAAS